MVSHTHRQLSFSTADALLALHIWLPAAAAKERILGFYSTGPRLREADLDISDLLSSYAESPLLLICEVQVGLLQILLTQQSGACV